MSWAERVAVLSSGLFFLVGLLCGTWKWLLIRKSAEAKAPYYVDAAHRVAFLSAFSCLLLERFAGLSRFSEGIEVTAVVSVVVFLALALTSYIIHGFLRDTDNQFARPHRLGKGTIPAPLMTLQMILLVLAEVGGFSVLFAGALSSLLL